MSEEKKGPENAAPGAEPSVIVDREQLGLPPEDAKSGDADAPAAGGNADDTLPASPEELEAEDREIIVGGKKRMAIKVAAVLLLAALLGIVIAFLVTSARDINRAAAKMAHPAGQPAVTLTGTDAAKVVVPAVVGADASKCKPDQWSVQEDGSIVFINCAVPVYADQK